MTFPLMPAHTGVIFPVLLSCISLAVGQDLRLVYGISNSSINLTSSFDPNNVKDHTWKHDINGTRYKIAKFKNDILFVNDFKRYNLFNNGTVLGINTLNRNDSGLYIVDVTLNDDASNEEYIYMTVLDPIPPVQIQIKEQKRIGDRCNVTLHCYVLSNTTDVSYTWKYKQGNSEYQQYNNGSTTQISLSLDHQDTEFICIVDNQADQKNASVHLVKHCLEENTRDHGILVVFLISMFVVVVVALLVVAVVCWKFRKRSLFTTGKGKVKNSGIDLDKKDELQYLNENKHNFKVMQNSNITYDQDQQMLIEMEEHNNDEDENEELFVTPPADTNDQDQQMLIEMEEHKTDEDENEELFITPPMDTSDLDGEIRVHIVEVHENEGHEDERNDHEGHETEEHENGGHENEEHLTILVEESRDQTEVEEHENNEPENEEHLTIPVEESGEQDGNNVNETEHEENLTVPVQETDDFKMLQESHENMEKIEHLHEDENTGGLLQDTSDLDEQDKVEEHKKNDDYENEDDLTLVKKQVTK
ncbi:uncharacterized protein LOC120982225 isoform X2 [Bufo bufo]|uniref:uncharacterized protein LOC120982225 isoform X1 n=1 Tax=Bufo bufo TaxID=8384 RepID=UPI001ABE08AA|nr:uncharacterized protein LOC120982225 isoform X1 [Bufo bufo]XP_040268169.1 uncharacterized protein LOC120982225 isoform X2 [Bufo bufo]